MAYVHKRTGRVLAFFVFLLFSLSAVAVPRERLHLVYVTNRDRDPLPNYKDRVHRIMVDVQDFFRTEMERNGHGPQTFQLDLDKDGKTVVHRVTLDWDFDPERKFTIQKLRPVIAEHLREKGIDIEQEYIITFENAYWKSGDTWKYDVVYTGVGDPVRGATWVVDHELLDPENIDPELKDIIDDRGQRLTTGQFNVKMIGGVVHEFGHGLGLPHNKETKMESRQHGTALMGAGNYTYRQERLGKRPTGSFLTPAHAFILSLHPLLNGCMPESFDVPDVFVDELEFKIKEGQLAVSGKAVPWDEVAGIVLYHDPLPTGTNKDYDAFSYLAEMGSGGKFAATIPLLDAESALHVKVYFKNGMHSIFSFTRGNGEDNGLGTLRNGYLWEQAKYAFKQKDAGQLRNLVDRLEKADPDAAKRARLFLSVAEQWQEFQIPAKLPANEKMTSLSSSRWDSANVGWYIPSFNGVMDTDGQWFRPLQSEKGNCPQGLYAHAPSSYVYTLAGKWKTFKSRIGIHRGRHVGSVVFVVKGDGKELFRSSLITLKDGEVPVEVDVSGAKKLELATEPGPDGTESDWGLWIAPSLLR
jgi:hypothetical protein